MTTEEEAEEAEFDKLPEALRLALMDRARRLGDLALADELPDQPSIEPPAMTMRQIGDAATIGRGSLHWRYVGALTKLRHHARRRFDL